MIRLESLSKGFGSAHLFSNLSLTIGKGEKCALIGRNGSGKTTLLRMISGEESSDAGKIHIPKNYRIGILTQHAKWTKSTPLEEAQAGVDGTEIEEWKASKMLFNLGFDDQLLHAPISSLSGGYCLRLQLA